MGEQQVKKTIKLTFIYMGKGTTVGHGQVLLDEPSLEQGIRRYPHIEMMFNLALKNKGVITSN